MLKGFKMTIEQKKHHSEARLKFFKEHPERKVNSGNYKKGHKDMVGMSNRARGKNHPFFGKKRSPKTRKLISQGKMGDKNPQWKGGISRIHSRIRHLVQYHIWRLGVYTRDNFTCQECGDNSKHNINAHHIKELHKILQENNIKTPEQAEICEELWNINNGKTLCEKCHNKTKTNKKNSSNKQGEK